MLVTESRAGLRSTGAIDSHTRLIFHSVSWLEIPLMVHLRSGCLWLLSALIDVTVADGGHSVSIRTILLFPDSRSQL